MPIIIDDSSASVGGQVKTTLGQVTASMSGANDTAPDTDGSIDRQIGNVTCLFQQAGPMDNYPFISCAFALGNIVDRTTNNPAKKIISYNNWFISQALFMNNSTNRLDTRNRLDELWSVNPTLHVIYHIDYLTVEFDTADFDIGRWLEDTADSIANDDDFFLRDPVARGGYYITHENSPGDGWAFNWGCSDTTMQAVVNGQISQWTDNDGPNGCINTGRPISWMEDTIPMYDFRYAQAGGGGQVKAFISSTEYQCDTIDWNGKESQVLIVGDPGTYSTMIERTNFIVRTPNNTSGDFAEIIGHKVINGTTDQVLLDTPLENLNQSAVGGEFSIMAKSSAQTSIRFFGSSNFGELTQSEWRLGIRNFCDRFVNTVKTNYALDVGAYCNMGARNGTFFIDGTFDDDPNSDTGKWDGFQGERLGQVIGFFQATQSTAAVLAGRAQYHSNRQDPPGGSAGGNTYSEDRMIIYAEYNKLLLRDNEDSHTRYPTVWFNAQVRSFGNDQGNYFATNGWDEIDAAYARFWAVFCWGTENLCPQIEADEGHDVPVMLDEQIIAAGNPVDARNYGSLNTATKVVTWDTPDFGTYGYRKRYANVWTLINFREPDSDPWVPHWLSGGQTIVPATDRYTFADVPVGKKLVRFDRSTYVHPGPGKFTGLGPTDFNDVDILKDTTWNDATLGPQPGGGYGNGDTIDIGCLEAIVLMIVDA